MNKNELERRLEAAEKQNLGLMDEIKNLKAQLAEMQDESEIPDFPMLAYGESYWYLTSDFQLRSGCSVSGKECDEFNFFHTQKYADEFAKKCKLIAMMLHCKWHLCRDFKEDFSQNGLKWYVYYANDINRFAADYCVNDDHGSVYFDTEENAQKAADWLNKHYLKENENE